MCTSKKRIVLLAGVALLGLVFSALFFYVAKAEAQRNLGPYMIMHHSNATATAGVFRVNQSTGYVSYCYLDASAKPSVICTPETP